MTSYKDLTTLTEFAPPQKEKSTFPKWLNPFAKRDDTPDTPPSEPRADPRITSSSTLIARIKNITFKNPQGPEAKKYWMPDGDAAVCYDCQQPFSVFVRRHHCRICGLLFCWKCSDHSIEDYQGSDSPIRVCNYCYGLLHAPYHLDSPEVSRRESGASQESENASPTQSGTDSPTPAPTGLHKLIYSTSFLKATSPFGKKDVSEDKASPPAGPPPQPALTYEGEDEDEDEMGMYDEDDDDSDEEELAQNQRPITPKASDSSSSSQNAISGTAGSSSGSFESFKVITERPPLPIPDEILSPRGKRVAVTEDGTEPSTPRARSASPITTQNNSAFVHLADASLRPLAQHPRVTHRDKSWAQFPLMRTGTLGLSAEGDDPAQAKTHKQHIEQAAERHLARMVSQLLAQDNLRSNWAQMIIKLAREVCKKVQLNVKTGDKMDVRAYVKVKKIPGGTFGDSKYVEGVVITKNVTHKKMKSSFSNPHILLLSCSLEYQRVENRLLFFDYLIPQEKPFLKILVSKIAALNPDLVLVEKTVSRFAQDFLLEENISLVSNVKPHVMERLARQLRGELLPTLDILLPTSNLSASSSSSNFATITPTASPLPPGPKLVKGEEGVGSCGAFHIERYSGDWGAKTLMYFEKCPKELGCTLTIRGGSAEELAKVKGVLLFSIYAAYSLHMEGYLLQDEHATFQADRVEKPDSALQPPFSCSSQVDFTEPPLPPRLLQSHINTYTYTPTRYASLHPRSKAHLISSFQSPHNHLHFGEFEYPSLLQLQGTIEDDSPTACLCNHPFSLERTPTDYSQTPINAPPSTPPTSPPSSSTSPNISSPSPSHSHSLTHSPSQPPVVLSPVQSSPQQTICSPSSSSATSNGTPIVAPVPIYPGRVVRNIPSPTPTPPPPHSPHVHGHIDAHGDAHAHDAEPHTAYSMQTLVYVHSLVCSTTATQCIPHELHAIDYYSENDITLGEFLEQMCFDVNRVCQIKECNQRITQHERAFIHGTGRLNITVDTVTRPVSPTADNSQIYISSYCKMCKTATPLTPMTNETWNYSFGKFLELSFYCTSAINQAPECAHSVYRDHIRYFSCGTLVTQITYEPIQRLHVVLPPIHLENDPSVKQELRHKELVLLTQCADQVYDAILAKLTQLQNLAEGGGMEVAQQVATFVHSLQKEKAVFRSKLDVARDQGADPNELRDLTRSLYANTMMWNSMLNEVVNNANNADAYKSKVQNTRKLATSSNPQQPLTEVSPRISRDISKQDLMSIAEHAADLYQASSPLHSPPPISSSHLSLPSSPQPRTLPPSTTATASPSAPGSEPGSGNTSFTNYSAISPPTSVPTIAATLSPQGTPVQTNSGSVTARLTQLRSSETGLQFGSPAMSASNSPRDAVNLSQENSTNMNVVSANANVDAASTPTLEDLKYDQDAAQKETENTQPISPAIQIEVSTPSEALPSLSVGSPNGGVESQSPNAIRPNTTTNTTNTTTATTNTTTTATSGTTPNTASASKPNKIMSAFNTFVTAISSSRILDPTIPYLFLPQHNETLSVAIYEDEPSTIIAYTLCSSEFKEKFDLLYKEFQPPAPTPSPTHGVSASTNNAPNNAANSTPNSTTTSNMNMNNNISTLAPTALSAAALQRHRSQSLSRQGQHSRSVSPEPRSRSASLVSTAASNAVASAAAAIATVKAVVTNSDSDSTPNAPPSIPSPNPSGPNPVTNASSSDSESSGSANSSINSFSSLPLQSETTVTPPPSINVNENSSHSSTPRGENTEDKADDGFTDRNVTLAKYLLCGDRREIRNKYQHDKHGSPVTIHCTTYYPLQFNAMRELMAGGEIRFIESLSRSKSWKAKGGKSGSTWAKTLDDRYVLKQISSVERDSFVKFAPQYFEYLCKAFFHKVPTLMSKIFGVFTVRWNGKRKDLIVMENLHYNTTLLQVYDLKGSLRGRLIENPNSDEVLLDENLLQTNFTNPICITEYSKTILGQAVWNDTAFLSSLNVMDYSLLAGVGKNGELVVGIIDYIREFTWDKQLERFVKTGVGWGRKAPTVISPKQYKARFRDAMWMYFVMVPNKFTRAIHPPVVQDKERIPQR